MTCTVCGIIHYEIFKNNYIDFYENMYKIRKKVSLYKKIPYSECINRYSTQKHIRNIKRYYKPCKTFNLISTILHVVNKDRKKIISIKFIIHKLFEKWNLNLNVPITKSKKTLNDNYEKYWNQICLLIEL